MEVGGRTPTSADRKEGNLCYRFVPPHAVPHNHQQGEKVVSYFRWVPAPRREFPNQRERRKERLGDVGQGTEGNWPRGLLRIAKTPCKRVHLLPAAVPCREHGGTWLELRADLSAPHAGLQQLRASSRAAAAAQAQGAKPGGLRR